MSSLDAVAALAPRAHAALLRAWQAAHQAVEPELIDSARRGVEAQLGLAPAGPEDALVDQFVLYVPGVTEELRAPLRARLGDAGLREFFDALYVLDQTTRLRLAYPGAGGTLGPALVFGLRAGEAAANGG